MKIHEYQGKAVLKKYGVAVRADRWRRHAQKPRRSRRTDGLRRNRVVVKAQIHAVDAAREAREDRQSPWKNGGELAGKILGMKL